MAARSRRSPGRPPGAGRRSGELYFEETEATFAIGWKGHYQIDGDAFVYIDSETARVTTVLGYPTVRLAQMG
jgi:hypothetical protein